eukprot:733252-Rhodomonas_salina.1
MVLPDAAPLAHPGGALGLSRTGVRSPGRSIRNVSTGQRVGSRVGAYARARDLVAISVAQKTAEDAVLVAAYAISVPALGSGAVGPQYGRWGLEGYKGIP